MPPPPQVNGQRGGEGRDAVEHPAAAIEAVDRVEVRPRVTGSPEKVARGGRRGQSGDLLFQIDDREYRAAHQRPAEADAAPAPVRRPPWSNARVAPPKRADPTTTSMRASVEAGAGARRPRHAGGCRHRTPEPTSPAGGADQRPRRQPGHRATRSPAACPRRRCSPPCVARPGLRRIRGRREYLPSRGSARAGERQSLARVPNPVRVVLPDRAVSHEGCVGSSSTTRSDPATGTIHARALHTQPRPVPHARPVRCMLLGSGSHDALLIHDRAVITDQDRSTSRAGAGDLALAPRRGSARRIDGLPRRHDDLRAWRTGARQRHAEGVLPSVWRWRPSSSPMDQPEQSAAPARAASRRRCCTEGLCVGRCPCCIRRQGRPNYAGPRDRVWKANCMDFHSICLSDRPIFARGCRSSSSLAASSPFRNCGERVPGRGAALGRCAPSTRRQPQDHRRDRRRAAGRSSSPAGKH